jgi:hypothetical protein
MTSADREVYDIVVSLVLFAALLLLLVGKRRTTDLIQFKIHTQEFSAYNRRPMQAHLANCFFFDIVPIPVRHKRKCGNSLL